MSSLRPTGAFAALVISGTAVVVALGSGRLLRVAATADTDPLTGLANRRRLDAGLQVAVERAARPALTGHPAPVTGRPAFPPPGEMATLVSFLLRRARPRADGGTGGRTWPYPPSSSAIKISGNVRGPQALVEACAEDVDLVPGRGGRRRVQVREAELQQVFRLAALGRLAAGLAHEINTPIQFVGDSTRFLAESCQDLLRMVLLYRDLLEIPEPLSLAERQARARRAEEGGEIDYLQAEIPGAIAQTLEGIDRVATIVHAMRAFSDPVSRHGPMPT
jgi:signal transduction histidine kinase